MHLLRPIYKKIFRLLPLKRNRVCFINFNGLGYGCNPKYIAEEMIKQGGWDIYWIIDKNKNIDLAAFPKQVHIIKMNKMKMWYYLSTSKFIISNARLNLWNDYKKKQGQKYIQTWHGHIAFKKIEADYPRLSPYYVQLAKKDSEYIDILSSGALWSEKTIFKKTFWYSGKYFRGGNPRNDIFFKHSTLIKNKICNYFSIPADVKICIYAPTFRDSYSLDVYNLDYERLHKALVDKFGGKWVILSRLHPNLSHISNILPKLKYVYDASQYSDIQELLAASDVLISDYSSCLFDFLLTGRPAFIYAPDKQYYLSTRGTYIETKDIPITVSQNNKQLIHNVQTLNIKEFAKAAKVFLNKIGSYDTGMASKRFLSIMKLGE